MISREQALKALEKHKTEMIDRLDTAQATVLDLERQLADAKTIRAALIGEATEQGLSYAQIGARWNLTRQRVAQLWTEYKQTTEESAQ